MLNLKPRARFVKDIPLITGEQLGEMSGLGRCELINGRINYLMPVKRVHSRTTMLIGWFLQNYNHEHDLGEVHGGETGVFTRRDPDTVRGMDAAFISHERLQGAEEDSFLKVAPELVVEVLSPSNRRKGIKEKIGEYFGIGVLVVWVVNPRRKQVEVYSTPTKFKTLKEDDVLTCENVLPGFSVPVVEIFGR